MNRFRFIIGALLLMIGVAAKAEIVITADQETTVKVAEVASMTFDGDFNTGNLVLNYIDGTNAKFPISSIKQLTLKTDEIDAIESVSARPTVAVQGDMLIITGNGGKVAIYDTAGRRMTAAELTAGTTPLSLGQLPNGIYVANINGHVVKFQKK